MCALNIIIIQNIKSSDKWFEILQYKQEHYVYRQTRWPVLYSRE